MRRFYTCGCYEERLGFTRTQCSNNATVQANIKFKILILQGDVMDLVYLAKYLLAKTTF